MKTFSISAVLIGAILLGGSLPTAEANPPSGLLLGIYAYENWQGLRVTSTMPGYSADGRLFGGDVLLRATTDGFNIYNIGTHWGMENAKDQIGPYTPAAIEFWRPGVGLQYAWVEFMPIGGGVQAFNKKQMKAEFKLESEKPGAKALFLKGKLGGIGLGNGGKNGNGGVVLKPFPFPKQPMPLPFPKPFPMPGGMGSPDQLFK
jgi:hypothetical protein